MRSMRAVWFPAVAVLGIGCTQGVIKWHTEGPGEAAGGSIGQGGYGQPSYESDKPGSGGAAISVRATASSTTSAGSKRAESDGASTPGSAERAIEEADILKIDGNRLYAFSRSGGLSVVDIGTRDRLQLLGTWQSGATPFELYVRNGVVFGLFNGWGKYVTNTDGTTSWVTTSEVVALDTNDAAHIKPLGTYDLPGEISDSRIVGDVLYAVSFQDGYCWKCQSASSTTVVSLNVGDPQHIGQADMLSFSESVGSYSWRRSITVTPERMYVAGPMYLANAVQPDRSIVQVVDITDPAGKLALGTSIEVAGQIDSRWQMDETDHVLRVISQPGTWDASAVPIIQTFSIASSSQAAPLGLTAMTLPRPERLQSVRFDGARAYAITTERTDPLFTVDLADPAHPVQAGQLEMPGWIYYMAPHGNRLLGLGYDQGNSQGSLTVSLFDVSNLATPTMLDRVNFGGNWGSLPEDQDRIHKAFQVLDDIGLITVPYSGWFQRDSKWNYSCGRYVNAVQLIDWAGDDLALRGTTPQKGEARRAVYHDERLFTVSEDRVEVFDIANRDQPVAKASLPLVLKVDRTLAAGENLVRFRSDYVTGAVTLEVVPASQPDARIPLGSLDLASALFPDLSSAGLCPSYYYWNTMPAFVNGTYVYLMIDRSQFASYYTTLADSTGGSAPPSQNQTEVAVIDIANPAAPTLVATKSVEAPPGYDWAGSGRLSYYGNNSLVTSGDQIAQRGSTVVVQRRAYEYTNSYSSVTDVTTTDYSEQSILEVFDLANPARIGHVRVDLGEAMGFSGLEFAGNLLVGSHWVPSTTNPDKIRFFIDRIDLDYARAPRGAKERECPWLARRIRPCDPARHARGLRPSHGDHPRRQRHPGRGRGRRQRRRPDGASRGRRECRRGQRCGFLHGNRYQDRCRRRDATV